jgi:hypothetical protein
MAEKMKSLLDTSATSAFDEGAARFERMIEAVKSQQAAPVARPVAAVTNPLLSVSPKEEWSRQYQSRSIGSGPPGTPWADLAHPPRAMVLPAADVAPVPIASVSPQIRSVALGAQIGKPEKPRRSWFGRLLRGT